MLCITSCWESLLRFTTNSGGVYWTRSCSNEKLPRDARRAGLTPAECEARIRVWHENFHKDYAVDLLLCHGLPAETKASETIAPGHRAQAINYLLLLELRSVSRSLNYPFDEESSKAGRFLSGLHAWKVVGRQNSP